MRYRFLGRSGLKVSAVAYGSWLTFGRMDEDTIRACARTALDAGVNFFDTADIYDRGLAEILLGRALQGVRREHLVLASKVFWPMSEDVNDRGLSRKHVFESCHGSLRRLGTDYLDLYQCHRFDPETPLEETVRAMGDLVAQGKILYWGTSMWSAAQLREACRIADGLGVPRPVSEQPKYNLLHREVEADPMPACRELGVSLVVYSPLAQGLLTGKYRRTDPPPPDSRGADPEGVGRFLGDDLQAERTWQVVETLVAAAAGRGLPPATLALAWCLRRDELAAVIVGATRPEQLAENLQAADLVWEGELEAALAPALATAP